MRVLRELDQPADRYALTFLGYAEESEACVLELTYNYGVSTYKMGNAYGHMAIGVEDCRQACVTISERGGKVTYGPSPLTGSNEVIAFVEDLDGYQRIDTEAELEAYLLRPAPFFFLVRFSALKNRKPLRACGNQIRRFPPPHAAARSRIAQSSW